jgi:hypothetical protein
MDQRFYYVLHLVSLFILTAYTFRAFAAPTPQTRRANLMITGIAALLALVAGFGLLAKLQLKLEGYLIVKLVCWLGLSALAGVAHKQGRAGALPAVAVVLIVVAAYCVYYKPF